MKKVFLVIVGGWLLVSCVSTIPMNEDILRPAAFSRDGTEGLLIVEGQPAVSIFIYAGKDSLIEKMSVGGNQYLSHNGRVRKIFKKSFDLGQYRFEVHPYYYVWYPLLGYCRYDFPTQQYTVRVVRNARQYFEGRYWGWIVRVHAGYIRQEHKRGVLFDIQTNLFR